jgi:hypothetical protein
VKQRRRRKCLHCGELFHPDARNAHHQRYCAEPACRRASKAASQRRWLSKVANRDYFRGAANVERVRAWRAEHPGYWRRGEAQTVPALQDVLSVQDVELHGESDGSSSLNLWKLLILFGERQARVTVVGM